MSATSHKHFSAERLDECCCTSVEVSKCVQLLISLCSFFHLSSFKDLQTSPNSYTFFFFHFSSSAIFVQFVHSEVATGHSPVCSAFVPCFIHVGADCALKFSLSASIVAHMFT